MTKTTAALKLAEEALYAELESDTCEEFAEAAEKCHKALAAIREVLAEQDRFAGGGKAITFPNLHPVINWLENGCDPKEAAKELRIYQEQMKTAPVSAKREWVELTDDEILGCLLKWRRGEYELQIASAVIAAFKEKNK